MRTRVKICGITNFEDARKAIELGADALGFIFVSGTPRFVTTETAYQIGKRIPPFVTKTAVMHDINLDFLRVVPKCFDAFQYYVNLRQNRAGYSHRRRIRAYRIKDRTSLDEIAQTCSEASAILLDTYHQDKLGGAGETFNWDLAVEAKNRFSDQPIILAGGLTSENVGEAIRKVRPYAVDVSSGVEAEPGRKDHAKLTAFFRAVRAADGD